MDAYRLAARAEMRQRHRAEAQTKIALTEAERNRRLLYVAEMNLAQQAWEAGNLQRAQELLERQRPGKGQEDLRGFGVAYAHAAGCRGYARSLAEIQAPAATIFIADSSSWFFEGGSDYRGAWYVLCPIGTHPTVGPHDGIRSASKGSGWVSKRHQGGTNATFMDGHAKWYRYERLRDPDPDNDIWGHTTTPPAGMAIESDPRNPAEADYHTATSPAEIAIP